MAKTKFTKHKRSQIESTYLTLENVNAFEEHFLKNMGVRFIQNYGTQIEDCLFDAVAF